MKWSLSRTQQCAKCPWRVATDPRKIPNGYDVAKHAALSKTIAKEGDLSFLSGQMHVMVCHESHEDYCVGWLMHQLGPGNNIGLRLRVRECENLGEVELRGKQHQRFEDTLPGEPP